MDSQVVIYHRIASNHASLALNGSPKQMVETKTASFQYYHTE